MKDLAISANLEGLQFTGVIEISEAAFDQAQELARKFGTPASDRGDGFFIEVPSEGVSYCIACDNPQQLLAIFSWLVGADLPPAGDVERVEDLSPVSPPVKFPTADELSAREERRARLEAARVPIVKEEPLDMSPRAQRRRRLDAARGK